MYRDLIDHPGPQDALLIDHPGPQDALLIDHPGPQDTLLIANHRVRGTEAIVTSDEGFAAETTIWT